jgi:hypothetical protein
MRAFVVRHTSDVKVPYGSFGWFSSVMETIHKDVVWRLKQVILGDDITEEVGTDYECFSNTPTIYYS